MKVIKTASYQKLSKKKEWNPNPWAVCTDSVGRENPDKYERCVQKVKSKQTNDKLKDKKDAKERLPWDSEQDFFDRIKDEFSGYSEQKKEDAMNDKWKMLMEKSKKKEPAYAKSKKDKKKKEPEMVKPFKR